MKTKKEKLNLVNQLVKSWNVEIIAIDMLGVLKFYVAKQLLPKRPYILYNELIGGKDITSLIENADFNNTYAMDRDQFAKRIANIPFPNFKFGTEYCLFMP